ncbi:MAG TPA: preprotein translocase subunit YajC [Mycobacteriales bacterium]|jgi:preprotein translocase subunit YajC|nr:preprotein translocase subunit YajC [Mycobacteriales bacterium]
MILSAPALAGFAAVNSAANAATKSNSGGLINLLFPLLLVVGVVFLFRQQRRSRAKVTQQSQAAMVPGTEVVTRAGMIGTLISTSDEEIVVEVAPGVRLRMLPGALARAVTPPAGDGDATPGTGDGSGRPELPPDDQPPPDRPAAG